METDPIKSDSEEDDGDDRNAHRVPAFGALLMEDDSSSSKSKDSDSDSKEDGEVGKDAAIAYTSPEKLSSPEEDLDMIQTDPDGPIESDSEEDDGDDRNAHCIPTFGALLVEGANRDILSYNMELALVYRKNEKLRAKLEEGEATMKVERRPKKIQREEAMMKEALRQKDDDEEASEKEKGDIPEKEQQTGRKEGPPPDEDKNRNEKKEKKELFLCEAERRQMRRRIAELEERMARYAKEKGKMRGWTAEVAEEILEGLAVATGAGGPHVGWAEEKGKRKRLFSIDGSSHRSQEEGEEDREEPDGEDDETGRALLQEEEEDGAPT